MEQLIEQLKRQRFDADQGDAVERAYRRGWNDCNAATVRQLDALARHRREVSR